MTSEIQLCHFGSRQGPSQISLQCLYKTFGFLSGGPVHSSNSTNTEAQLSMGWSGVNFTAGRMRACDCSGLLRYPGHAYSVAGPWATAEGEGSERSMSESKSQTFHLFLSLLSPPLNSFFLSTHPLCVSPPLPIFLDREESRGD